MNTTVAVCSLALFIACPFLQAGSDRGEISGIVRDSRGAPVPFACVTFVEPISGHKCTVTADANGTYRSGPLAEGTWNIRVQRSTVDEYQETGVAAHPGDHVDVPISEPAEITPPGEWQYFPSRLRNYLDLIRELPGISPGQPGGNLEGFGPYAIYGDSAFNSNGQRAQNNAFLIDAADNNNPWIHGELIEPSLEGLRYADLFSTYVPPEFGDTMAAAVNAHTQSGENHLHGNVFEYFQNSALDARNFFDGPHIPGMLQNDFGGALGGALQKDKWFFFISAESLREKQGLTILSTVPTNAEKAGIFGNTAIYDPLSLSSGPAGPVRDPFAGNTVPAARISEQARDVIRLYPDPNLPGTFNNYLFTPNQILNQDRWAARSDKTITAKSNLSVAANYQRTNEHSPGALPASSGLPSPFVASDITQNANDTDSTLRAWNARASYILVPTPHVINELRADATGSNFDVAPDDSALNAGALLGIPGLTTGGLPVFSIIGYASLGAPNGVPMRLRMINYELADNLTWTIGRHSLHFGFQGIRRDVDGDDSEWTNRGTFIFTPDYTSLPGIPYTGNSIASLLLGDASEVQRGIQYAPFLVRGWEWSAFVQDDFRIGRRLTIRLGLRYSFLPPITEANDHLVNFDFSHNAPAVNQFAAESGVNEYAGRGFHSLALEPRIGLAWDVLGNGATVLRGQYSTAYDPGTYIGQALLAQNPPFGALQDSFSGSLQLGPNLSAGFAPPPLTSLTNPQLLNAPGQAIYAIEPGNYTPYSEQWGLFLQQRLRPRLTLEIAGTASMGVHLYSSFDLNQASPGPAPIDLRRDNWSVPLLSRIEYLSFAGGSTYYGGQVKLRGQLRSGFDILASYTYSKALDDSSEPFSDQESRPSEPQDIHFLRGMRSPSPFDVTQRVAVLASYRVPSAKTANGNTLMRLIGGAISNWRLDAVVTAQTGLPFTPELAANGLNNGDYQLPNRLANGSLPSGSRSYLHWFDTALTGAQSAFATPPLFEYGNSGFDILRAPGLATVDAALSRSFPISERLRFDTRAEAFNLLNRTNFGIPNRILGLDSSGAIDHTSTSARQIQLVARFAW